MKLVKEETATITSVRLFFLNQHIIMVFIYSVVTILVDSPLMTRFGEKGFVVTTGKKYWGPLAVPENNQLFLVNNESESLRCPCDALLQKGKYLITGTLPEGRRWPQFTEHDLVLPFSSYRKLEEKVRNECSELY